jgi:hypothetical protein
MLTLRPLPRRFVPANSDAINGRVTLAGYRRALHRDRRDIDVAVVDAVNAANRPRAGFGSTFGGAARPSR